MHDFVLVEVGDGFANVPKVGFDLFFAQGLIPDFLKEGAAVRVLEYHVGDLSLSVDEVPEQLDDVLVVEFLVEDHFVVGEFVHLRDELTTILTATFLPVFLSIANLTCPYDPNPTVMEWSP